MKLSNKLINTVANLSKELAVFLERSCMSRKRIMVPRSVIMNINEWQK